MIVWLVLALVGGVYGAVDLTLMEKATGSAVVNAVVDTITQSCVFDNDRLMLRRIAYAETRDGAASFTFTRGGIWQVCEQDFLLAFLTTSQLHELAMLSTNHRRHLVATE